MDRALFSFLPVDLKLEPKDAPKDAPVAEKVSAANLQARLKKLLEAPAYTNFVGLDEKKYTFTAAEKEVILKRGEKFFTEFETELVKQVGQRLENANRDLGLLANESVEDSDITAKLEQRIVDLAKLILTDQVGTFRGWALDAKGDLNKQLKEDVEARSTSRTSRNSRTRCSRAPCANGISSSRTASHCSRPSHRASRPPAWWGGGAPPPKVIYA